MKTCTKCHQTKPPAEFNKNSAAKDGLTNSCRDCNKAAAKVWRENNREKRNAYQRIRNQRYKKQRKGNPSVDVGLHALLIHALPGQTCTLDEISEVCECSRKYISLLERQALDKIEPLLAAWVE